MIALLVLVLSLIKFENMTFKPVFRTSIAVASLFLALSILAFKHIDNNHQSNEKQIQNGVNVVELFTSQGCSSCPPADALLDKIKDRENVIALSYHVDYWNYLGWKDPYSAKEFSIYQRTYASKLNSGVYTPQMVVNGSKEFVGSKEQTLNNSLSKKSMVISLEEPKLQRSKNAIEFTYSLDQLDKFDNAHALLLIDEQTTSISKGENARKKLKNSNVVIQRISISKKSGKEKFTIPEGASKNYKVAIIAQDKNFQMLGAALSTLE